MSEDEIPLADPRDEIVKNFFIDFGNKTSKKERSTGMIARGRPAPVSWDHDNIENASLRTLGVGDGNVDMASLDLAADLQQGCAEIDSDKLLGWMKRNDVTVRGIMEAVQNETDRPLPGATAAPCERHQHWQPQDGRRDMRARQSRPVPALRHQ